MSLSSFLTTSNSGLRLHSSSSWIEGLNDSPGDHELIRPAAAPLRPAAKNQWTTFLHDEDERYGQHHTTYHPDAEQSMLDLSQRYFVIMPGHERDVVITRQTQV
jgi:hypothetical protein